MMRIVQYLLSAYVYDICIICAYMTYTLAYVYDICIICAHMTYTYMEHVHYVCSDMKFLCHDVFTLGSLLTAMCVNGGMSARETRWQQEGGGQVGGGGSQCVADQH